MSFKHTYSHKHMGWEITIDDYSGQTDIQTQLESNAFHALIQMCSHQQDSCTNDMGLRWTK